MSTGIMDTQGLSLLTDNTFIQEFQVENKFNTLVEFVLSRSSIRLLTQRLLLHDVNNKTSFREADPEKNKVNLNFKREDINSVLEKIKPIGTEKGTAITPNLTQHESLIFNNLSKAYEYDFDNLKKKLEIKRIDKTDLLSVEYEAETPELAAFVANGFCEEMIAYYSYLQDARDENSVSFLINLAESKKAEVDSLRNLMKDYKLNEQIVNLSEQQDAVINQIKDLELRRSEESQKIPGLKENINQLDDFITEKNKKNASNPFNNDEIVNLSTQIEKLIDQQANISAKDKKSRDAIQKQIDALSDRKKNKIQELAGTQMMEGRRKKDKNEKDIYGQKIDTELELERTQKSVHEIDSDLAVLRGRAGSLVSHDAFVRSLQQELELAEKEYSSVVEKLNNARLVTTGVKNPLDIVEYAQVPEKPEASKRILFSTFGGVAAATLTSILVFLFAFFDNSLNSAQPFKTFTHLDDPHQLLKLSIKDYDIAKIFSSDDVNDKVLLNFQESLRKLRFQMENAYANVFLITSLKEREGKTFTLINIAYSLSLNGNKVLLIDTNFKSNTLSALSQSGSDNSALQNAITSHHLYNIFETGKLKQLPQNSLIDVLMCQPSAKSPYEIFIAKQFNDCLRTLQEKYDYILMESASLNKYSDGRELADFAHKIILVFDAGKGLNNEDKANLNYVKSLGLKFLTSVLNKIDPKNYS